MERAVIGIYGLVEDAKIPIKAHLNDACYDLYSVKDMLLLPNSRKACGTGIVMAIPDGFEGQLRPRSGNALKKGLFVVFGTIDAGYRGEIIVILYNMTDKIFYIDKFDKIAQIAIRKVYDFDFIEIESKGLLGKSKRGEQGFGSTGD